MAYDKELDYIYAPISIHDVQQALGVGSTDLGALCTSAKINKWSKKKPVGFPGVEPDRTKAVTVDGKDLWWWKGIPSVQTVGAGLKIGNYECVSECVWITNCGIRFLGFSSAIDALRAFNVLGNPYAEGDGNPLDNNFEYIPPKGGEPEPYRLVDFDNYSGAIPFCIMPGFETESGTELVDIGDQNARVVTCNIDSYDSSGAGVCPLSLNDLFGDIGSAFGFTVLLGAMNGNDISSIASGIGITQKVGGLHREVTIDFSGATNGATYYGLYCIYVTINGNTYYVPVMQSANAHPNTTIAYAPKRRCYKSWHTENIGGNTAGMSFKVKENYGVSFPWYASPSWTVDGYKFNINGAMNRIYMKVDAPRKSSGYVITPQSISLEIAGEFLDPARGMQLVYYNITASDTKMVLKNQEVEQADWGSSDTYNGQAGIYIEPGSGTQTFYIAIYNLFQNIHAQYVTGGGTIWRMMLGVVYSGGSFDVAYGGLDANDRMNVSVSAIP